MVISVKNFKYSFSNKKLFILGFEASYLKDEIPLHLFFDYHSVKSLWTQLDNYLLNNFWPPTVTPQTLLFGIFDGSSIAKNVPLLKYMLLIFKVKVYKSGKKY